MHKTCINNILQTPLFQIIQAEIGDTKKTISDTWFQL